MHSNRGSARKTKNTSTNPSKKNTLKKKQRLITTTTKRKSSTTNTNSRESDGAAYNWTSPHPAQETQNAPKEVDLDEIEAFKRQFLKKEMAIMSSPTRHTAFESNPSSTTTPTTLDPSEKVELQSPEFEPMHQLITGNQRLTRKQTRELLEYGSNSNIVNDLIRKVPAQYSTCRGCGIGLQCDSEHKPGFIPSQNLQSYLLRLDIQMRAAKQDLRIRSGGGKGQGTAVAALHASLKSSLGQLQREQEARTGKLGRFTEESLNKMGLDKYMKPLEVDPIVDPETGLLVYPEHPEDNPSLANLDHLNTNEVKVMRKELNRLLNDPEASTHQINTLQGKINDIENSRPDWDKEQKKIRKDEVLDKRDIDLLTKAAKMAARPAKCQRCHRIGSKQYGAADANPSQSVPAEDFVNLLKNEFQSESAKSSIIVQVIDVLDFHGSIIQDLQKLTGPRNPIILAVNKCDILPRDVSPLQVKMWAKKEAEKYGLHVHSVFPISASTGAGVDELMEKALILARGNNDPNAPRNRNIYVMGTTNVGKSSLINQLLQKGVCGTGMPNDVTHIKRAQKLRNNGADGGDGDNDIDPNDAQSMDTQPFDDEMEQELINTKKAERAAKKNNKDASSSADGEINFNDSNSIAKVLMTSKRDRDRPDVNPVIADIDVAGINQNALQAVLPDQYLLQHQREIQLKEAVSTTSPIPGTTLGIVSFPILEKKRGGKNLQVKDTPGVLNSWQLTSHLNYPELKRVLPTKRIAPLTYRLQPGQSIFLGAMARVDMIAGKPYHITNFVSNAVSVHIAASHRADEEYLRSQIGVNLIPPFDPEGETDHNGTKRVESLNIFDNLSNPTQAECEALESLQHLSKAEAQLANERSTERIHNQYMRSKKSKGTNHNDNNDGDDDGDDYDDNDDGDANFDKKKAFGKKNVTENIPNPKNGLDDLAHRRKALRDQISTTLGKLAPVVTPSTVNPSRVFMDSHGRMVIQLVGEGFHASSHDIVIAGLGWITVTGSGPCTLRVSVAGEKAQLKDYEMAALEEYHYQREDSSEIFVESNIQEHLDNPVKRRGPKLPTRVRKLLSRVVVRDPLITNLGRQGTKWTGLPELVKKSFTPAMAQHRARIMKHNELLALHRKNPEIHPHPDELEFKHDMKHPFAGDENYENFTQADLLNRNPLVHSVRLTELQKFELELQNDPKLPKHKVSNPYGAFDNFGDDEDSEEKGYEKNDDMLDHPATTDDLKAAGQRPKNDTQKGQFDAVPHPPVKHHSEADIAFQKEKLEHKMEEKAVLDDWEFIQGFREKKLLEQSNAALSIDPTTGKPRKDVPFGAAKEFSELKGKEGDKQLEQLRAELLASRPNKTKQNQILDEKALLRGDFDEVLDPSLKKKKKQLTDPLDEEFEDSMGSEMDSYDGSDEGSEDYGENGKKLSKRRTNGLDDSDNGEYGDDDDEELMDMDAIYDGMTTDSEAIEVDDEVAQMSSKLSNKKLPKKQEGGSDYDDISDFSGEEQSGPDLTDDVELLTNMEDMPTLEEMSALSDFDGVDYNDLRRHGTLDQYLAQENEKIGKRPVPTGPQGKRETGGRRAREAMGMITQNKFEDVKRAQLAKEAKLLHSYIKNANKAAALEEKRSHSDKAAATGRGNRGIIPKGDSNAKTSGKQWENAAYKFQEQNQAKDLRRMQNAQRNSKYGPDSDDESGFRQQSSPRQRGAFQMQDDGDDEIGAEPRMKRGQPKQRTPRFEQQKSTGKESFPSENSNSLEYPGGEVSYDYETRGAKGKDLFLNPQDIKPDGSFGSFGQNKPRQPRQQQQRRQFDADSDEGFETDNESGPPQRRQSGGFGGPPRGDRNNREGGFGGPPRGNREGGFGGPPRGNREGGFGGPPRGDRNNREGGFGDRNGGDRRNNNNNFGGERRQGGGFGGDRNREGNGGFGGNRDRQGGGGYRGTHGGNKFNSRRDFHSSAFNHYLTIGAEVKM